MRANNLPVLFSEIIKDHPKKQVITETYRAFVRQLAVSSVLSEEERAFIQDFEQTLQQQRTMAPTVSEPLSGSSQDPGTCQLPMNPQMAINYPKINVNELIYKPEPFSGYKPRDFIEVYEDAYLANDWPETLAIKYFPSFLRGTALAWYKEMVRPNLGEIDSWSALKKKFTDHYLGKAEMRAMKKELHNLTQGPREPATSFVPKALRLIRLSNPGISTECAIEKIIDKLRPELSTALALQEPNDVEELVQLCGRLEHREQRIADRRKASANESPRYTSGNNRERAQTKMATKGQNKKDTSNVKCYRCYALGHIAKSCTATKTVDGKPVRERVAKSINVIDDEDSSDGLNDEVVVTDRIRTINSKLKARKGSDSISCSIRCNKETINGVVDTGAYYTVVDKKLVDRYGWKIEGTSPILQAAGKTLLRCPGLTKIDFELTLGDRTRCATMVVAVVEELGTDLLLGREFAKTFKLNIDAETGGLTFKPLDKIGKGIVAPARTTLPARSISIIKAQVGAEGTVLSVPNDVQNGILVANSVCKVESNSVRMLLCNPTSKAVHIEKGTQLATFEELDGDKRATGEPKQKNSINTIAVLGNGPDTVSFGDELDSKQTAELSAVLNKNLDAFSRNGQVGKCLDERFAHRIELNTDAKPFNERLRRRPQIHVDAAKKIIRGMLADDVIEESSSPWASAYLLVKKKNGDFRLCIDFRRLNAYTKKMAFPIPNIEDCLDRLNGKKYFSLIDFNNGFWQLPVEKTSRELTAFKTEEGLFQFKRMPFGLANAPASFQRMINAMLAGLRGLDVQAFMDDVCISSNSWQEHLSQIDMVLKIVIRNNLTLRPEKCVFGTKRAHFLGHVISEAGISKDPAKVKAIESMNPPTDVAGVRRVMGLLGYYRKFVPKFAIIAAPLTQLLRKNARFVWSEREQNAFDKLIKALVAHVTLANFNNSDPVIVKTDASKTGVAAMLLQRQANEWRLISCCSRRLNDAEENYPITELEGLAVVYALNKLRPYLLGRHFKIITDHSALCVWNTKDPTSARLKRWALTLSEFDYEIQYTRGSTQADVDCLSRAPADDAELEPDDRVYHIASPIDRSDWAKCYDNDQSRRFLELAKGRKDNFRLINDVIYLGDKLFVPEGKVGDILRECHASPIAGHGGVNQTLMRLSLYWWPSIRQDTEKFVSSCEICQKRKTDRHKPAGNMHSFEVYGPGQLMCIDLLGPITQSLKLNKHVIVAVDCFSKFMMAKAVPDTGSSTLADFLLEMCGVVGIPNSICSDNASTFKNEQVKTIEKVLGIEHRFSAPMHSRGNAVAERAIQSLQERLSLILSQTNMSEECWDVILPVAVLSLNTATCKTTGFSPFELTYGRKHQISGSAEIIPPNHADTYARLLSLQMDNMRVAACEQMFDQQDISRKYFNNNHRHVDFDVGALVLIKTKSRSSKLANKYVGPYTVLSKSNDIYQLKDTESGSTLTRHVSNLKKFTVI